MAVSAKFTSELITSFSTKYNLRIQLDECGDPIISGRQGHLYEYGPTELGLMILPPGNPRPRLWNSILKDCLAVGMTPRQRGDAEGVLSFDPVDPKHSKVAIRAAKARPKRQVSEEQRLRLAMLLERARENRKNSVRNGTSGAFLSSQQTGAGETTSFSNVAYEVPSYTENSCGRVR
jgi:hypothetical protein